MLVFAAVSTVSCGSDDDDPTSSSSSESELNGTWVLSGYGPSSYNYDKQGRIISINGSAQDITYGTGTISTSYGDGINVVYKTSGNGLITSATVSRSNTTLNYTNYEYDSNIRLISSTETAVNGTKTNDEFTWSNGLLTKQQRGAYGMEYVYEYDEDSPMYADCARSINAIIIACSSNGIDITPIGKGAIWQGGYFGEVPAIPIKSVSTKYSGETLRKTTFSFSQFDEEWKGKPGLITIEEGGLSASKALLWHFISNNPQEK